MNRNQLHQWLVDYNWDDGLTPIWPVVGYTNTDASVDLLTHPVKQDKSFLQNISSSLLVS